MNFLFFSLLAAVLFSFSIIVGKYVAKHVIPNPKSLFALNFLAQVPNILLIPLFGKINFPPQSLNYIFGYSVMFVAGIYLYNRALYLVDASVIGPLFQLQGGFIVLLAAIFLKETFPPIVYIFILTMLLGAVLVSVNERLNLKSFLSIGVIFLVGMQALHAVSNIFVGFALKNIDFWNMVFFGSILNVSLILPYIFITKPKLNYSIRSLSLVYLRGTCQFFGAAALFRAFQENVSLSSVIGLMSAPIVFLVTVITSHFYPQLLEHHSRKVYFIRAIGLVIILIPAILIALNKSA